MEEKLEEHQLCEHLDAEDTLGEDPVGNKSGEDARAVLMEAVQCEHLAAEDTLWEDPEGNKAGEDDRAVLLEAVQCEHRAEEDTLVEVPEESASKMETTTLKESVGERMFTKVAVSVEDPYAKREMTSLALKESVGEEMFAEAVGSVDEIEVRDTGQAGLNLMVEDPRFQRDAIREATVTVSEYFRPMETADMLMLLCREILKLKEGGRRNDFQGPSMSSCISSRASQCP